MPRSHRPRKRYVPKRLDLDPMDLASARAALLPPARRLELVTPVLLALEGMRTGTGGMAAWSTLADAMNVAERLAAANIANDHADTLTAGQAALHDVFQRHDACGSWTLRAAELSALRDAVEIHEVQLEVCTQGELYDAILAVKERVRQALAGNAPVGARICVGSLAAQGAAA